MKNKTKRFLKVNFVYPIITLFATWGILFLITNNIFEIKPFERVNIFIESNELDENYKFEIKEELLKNDDIYEVNIKNSTIEDSFDTCFNKYFETDIFILSENTLNLISSKEGLYEYFLPIDIQFKNDLNFAFDPYTLETDNYAVKSNYKTYNGEETNYFYCINYNSKIFETKNIKNYSMIGFYALNTIEAYNLF